MNNAYVSGMKQDLDMQGNEFNVGTVSLIAASLSPAFQIINTTFTCGYIIGMIPSAFFKHRLAFSMTLLP